MLEGLPPNGAAHLARMTCSEDEARAIADIVVETFDPAETAASAFEETISTQNWNAGSWIVEIYFGFAPDEDAIRALFATVVGAEKAREVEFLGITQKDWLSASLDGLSAVRAGRFVVHGGHDRAVRRPNDIAMEIEAALAFGTGHHGSTRGCLTMIDAILKRKRPQAVLDIGCGTGVLAMAAAKALHQRVALGDIDPVSVAATRANARLNGAHPYLRPVTARGADHPDLRKGAPYDLILANILARPLRQLAPSLSRLAAPDADIVLSGLLACDVAGVLDAWRAQGFYLQKRIMLEGWATLLLSRHGQNPKNIPKYSKIFFE